MLQKCRINLIKNKIWPKNNKEGDSKKGLKPDQEIKTYRVDVNDQQLALSVPNKTSP
jgi:hypothetical protein